MSWASCNPSQATTAARRPTPLLLLPRCAAFDVLSRLPRQGVGAKLSRSSWREDSYWLITDVRMAKDGRHGTAWGLWTWRGEQQNEQPRKINGPLKKVWRALPDERQQQLGPWTSLAAEALQRERAAAAAAEAAASDAGEGEQQHAAGGET